MEETIQLLNEALGICDKLYNHIQGIMNLGEGGCPFCEHRYQHDPDCPFMNAVEILRGARSGCQTFDKMNAAKKKKFGDWMRIEGNRDGEKEDA